MIEIYTDGARRGDPCTPAPASWAMAVYIDGEYKGKKSGVLPIGTNNQAELEAVIQALDWCTRHGDGTTTILTDSAYVQNGCTTWIHGWVRKGWVNSKGEPVKNLEQWKKIDTLLAQVPTTLRILKVKGHSGNVGNDKADALCNEALDNWS